MEIQRKTVVQFHYRLFEQESGAEIESSHGGHPTAYLHGYRNIMPALEKSMLGKKSGDSFSAELAAKDAYGEYKPDQNQRVPVKHLILPKGMSKNAKLKPGQVVAIQTEQGQRQATVIKAGKFTVDVDTNHLLAGKDLRFDIEIVDVREATDEEISHGHAHGVGGHHH